MTLANLKKRAPSANRPVMSIDDFIEDAEYYANGLSKVVNLPCQNMATEHSEKALKRATFTLGEPALTQLNSLSERTGIPKSRLIRIWLDAEQRDGNILVYLNSQIK